MLTLHPIDWALIASFFIVQAYFGFRQSFGRRKTDAEDYLIAGRQLTMPAFVASLVSTWYSGILGVGEYSYLYGVSNWLVFGVPYYLWALVFALFLARKARRTYFISLPDQVGRAYGRGPGLVSAAMVFIMAVPAANVLMLAEFGHLLLGWPIWLGASVGAGMSITYLFIGGFRSAIRTDILQFICMFAGFALILPYSYHALGGWTALKAAVPPLHLTWHGGNSGWFIASWYFIATSTLVDPAFYQRCYAAKDEQSARRGIFWSIIFWIIFDFMTTTAGLYARAAVPNLDTPAMSYPALAAKVLPVGIIGLFFVGMIATVVSGVDSYMFIAAISLGRDVMSRVRTMTDRGITLWTRWALLISAVISVLMAVALNSVIAIWRDIGSIAVTVLLLPVLFTFREQALKIPPKRVVIWMVVPGAVSFLWIMTRVIAGHYPLGLEPIFPGLAVSLILWVIVRRS
jgi:SSS family solute:Na+ symporter